MAKRKITQKNYNDLKEMTASEFEAVARMATSMAKEVRELEEANEENFDRILDYDRSMRTAFHALAKGFMYQAGNPRYWGTEAREAMRQALDNVGRTIEAIERGDIAKRRAY